MSANKCLVPDKTNDAKRSLERITHTESFEEFFLHFVKDSDLEEGQCRLVLTSLKKNFSSCFRGFGCVEWKEHAVAPSPS